MSTSSDTKNENILAASINSPNFQLRCWYRFINAAISVTTESSSTASHAQRLALAGALFHGDVDRSVMAMAVLANATNQNNCITGADPSNPVPGLAVLDSDIDFQINSVFTGIATSRSW